MSALFLVSVFNPERPRTRPAQYIVLATSEAAAIPTLRLERPLALVNNGRVDVVPWSGLTVRLEL